VSRFAGIKDELGKLYDSREMGLDIADLCRRMGGKRTDAQVTQGNREIGEPRDYLENALNVVVVGVSFPAGIMDRTGLPPAEAVGPHSMFAHDCSGKIAGEVAFDLAKRLSDYGYRAVPVADLARTASKVAHTFGHMDDLWCSRYAAVLAGLGEIGWHGSVLTPEFGVRQRFFCVVTDAPLVASPLYEGNPLCDGCKQCVASCPVRAIADDGVSVTLGGKTWTQARIERLRCDWSKRYALVGDEGPKHMGCTHNIMPPDVVTPESIVEAMQQMDPLQKRIPCIAEPCLIACHRRK
jgi:ferredoxin